MENKQSGSRKSFGFDNYEDFKKYLYLYNDFKLNKRKSQG